VFAAIFLGNTRLKKSDTGAVEGKKEKLNAEMEMI
jgi:hypothetical protein